MNQSVTSQHPVNNPGFSHSPGATIVWDEMGGTGARPETVLRMVLDRVKHLQSLLPCEENIRIIESLQQALHWEQVRNEARAAQGVQGTLNPHISATETSETPEESTPQQPTADVHYVHQPPNPELEVREHPHPLDIAIPTQDGRFIPQSVIASIENQGIPYRLWISTKYSNGEYAMARNHTKDLALQGTSPYILMTDNDIVFPNGAFEAMITWLEENPDFGMVAISKHGDPDPGKTEGVIESFHIDAGPCMFRRSVYEKFTYTNKGQRCECGAMSIALREEHNVRIGFLRGWTVQHMQNTRLTP